MAGQRATIRHTTVIVTAVVALVAVGVIGYQYGRRSPGADPTTGPTFAKTSPTMTSPSTSSAATGPAASSSPYASTTSTSPAGLPRGAAVAAQGGRTSGPAGLPLGYRHDRAGAVDAATNYLMWMTSLRIADKQTADAMATASAADDGTKAAMIHSFDVLRSGMENLTIAQTDPARGAYAIPAYSATAARIYIWAPLVTVASTDARQSLWGITEVRLVWRDGDWKVDRTLVSREGGTAVDPSDPDGNPSAAEKLSILSRTPADPGEITDSAAQSWFEYANAKH